MPIKFASSEGIAQYENIAEDFFERILGFSNDDPVLITDKSSLWDFHTNNDNAEYINRIRMEYNVDVSDIEDANLLSIFEKISQSQKK